MEKPKPRSINYSLKNLEVAKRSIGNTGNYCGRSLAQYKDHLGIRSIKSFENKKVLDLGAGDGLKFARELEQEGIHADVISFSPALAKKDVRRNAIKLRPEDKAGYRMVAGMGEELPFADGTFDRVVSHSVTNYITTRERYSLFLQEIARVLAPGGVAYIVPAMPHMEEDSRKPITDLFLQGLLDDLARLGIKRLKPFAPINLLVLKKR